MRCSFKNWTRFPDRACHAKVSQAVSLERDEAEIARTFLGQGLNCSDCLLRAEHTVWKLRYFVAPPHVSQALDDADACRQ